MSGKMTDADRARQFVTYYAEGALPFDYREKMVVALTHALAEVRAEATEEKPSEPCPSCARKDAALREQRESTKVMGKAAATMGAKVQILQRALDEIETGAVAMQTEVMLRPTAHDILAICDAARAALAEAAPAAGEHPFDYERGTDRCKHCGRLDTEPHTAPPAAPEPERGCHECGGPLEPGDYRCEACAAKLLPLVLGIMHPELRDPAPEPER